MSVGFLSLSQEILWIRLISFILKGVAQSFPLVLFCFLIGIGAGAALGKRFCERGFDLFLTSTVVLLVAAVIDVSLVLLLPALMTWPAGLVVVLVLVVLTAGLKSVIFPIAHHLGSQQSGARVGRSVSRVYFGNIVGSTLGPIITGYVLLDQLTVDQCLLLVGGATSVLALMCALRVPARFAATRSVAVAVVLIAVALWLGPTAMIPSIALATQKVGVSQSITVDTGQEARITNVIQNRHGIIHTVSTSPREPDTVLGGNVYDGRLNANMTINYNGLDRGLVLLGMHAHPERVLLVGLSAGAWARVLTSSQAIKQMTVVEINPGYLEVIAKYPEVAPVLSDPRVKIVIDDGRRWLRSHKKEKFDLIVQNTTFSWRAYSANLLSREYMQLVRSHLRTGGIAAFNSTYSSDVLETARNVFPFVQRRDNFIYGSDNDFSRPTATAERSFRELQLDSRPVFGEADFAPGGIVRSMVDEPFTPVDKQYDRLSPSPGVITDQNLLSEHAHGKIREVFPRFYRAVDKVRSAIH